MTRPLNDLKINNFRFQRVQFVKYFTNLDLETHDGYIIRSILSNLTK